MDHGTYPWCGFRLILFDQENIMKHVKYFKGVPMKLSSPKGRVRTLGTSRQHLKDGHGCVVKVGMIAFHSEYAAKRFIKALGV